MTPQAEAHLRMLETLPVRTHIQKIDNSRGLPIQQWKRKRVLELLKEGMNLTRIAYEVRLSRTAVTNIAKKYAAHQD